VARQAEAQVDNPIRFQGQYADPETGLHYNRFRYYDPGVARYVTPDPIGLLGGLNAAAYVSDPNAWVDPLGLSCVFAGGAKVPQKRGPKTDPLAPHNATIRREANRLTAEGNHILAGGGGKEKLIPTPGGFKSGRRPDILYETPDGTVKALNVGKTKADGTPVTREQKAIDDLAGAGVETHFVPYDR